MCFFTLISVICSLSLGLARNKTGLGGYWNTIITLLTAEFISNSLSLELAAIIQIQVGNLSGSGIITLSNVAPASQPLEVGDSLNSTFNISELPGLEVIFPSCPNSSLFNVTTANLYQNSSGFITGVILMLTSTTSATDLGLFTGSGVQIRRRLPDIPAILLAIFVWLI